MPETISEVLTPWSSFYIMTGSSAAALTGLMFVVITLASGGRLRQGTDGISTYSTPTVVHFSMALFVSALLVAPWRSLEYPAVILGVAGAYGMVFAVRVLLRSRHLATYRPDLEDWTWHSILPLIAYTTIVAGAVLLDAGPSRALFAMATSVVVLIFVGIHNAWDVVTYLALYNQDQDGDEPPHSSAP